MIRRRRKSGSAITEFGPALLIFFLFAFFPFMDLLGLGTSYGLCWYLNYKISNQVARARQNTNGTQLGGQDIANQEVGIVSGGGFANFLKVQSITSTVTYQTATIPQTVSTTTSITAMPFLTIPWVGSVPGLNAPITFTLTAQLPREVTL